MNVCSKAGAGRAARHLVLQLAAAAVLLAGCGGGGDAGTQTSGSASSSFAAGAISGFGSVIVNGVRFDDRNARVTDDDGESSGPGSLRLGMRVEIHGGPIGDDGTGPRAEAREIRFGSELVGPVTALDAAAKSLVVLGQTVLVLDTTVFDDRLAGGFAAIAVGTVLEVHGTRDVATSAITATRIEPAGAAGFKLRGVVSELDTTAKTFRLGTTLVSYATVASPPANLANGLMVRVKLQTTPVAGAFVATRLEARSPRLDDAEAEIEGSITAFTSNASFSVNGIPVDASQATFPKGTTGLVLGARVEVHGAASNGVVVASRVKVENHAERRAEGFRLHGAVTSVDTVAKTFVLRGTTVGYASPAVEFRKGTATQLATGVELEVRGTLTADGTMLEATRITFGD
jgi:hypothetical protein